MVRELTEEEITAIQDAHQEHLDDGQLVVHKTWFELDAYGAAVSGILGAIKLGLESPTLGQGAEEEILRLLRQRLYQLDPDIKREE